MWNVIHNGVINQIEVLVDGIICYVDDTLLIIGARNRIDAENQSFVTLEKLSKLLAENGLELNQIETEVLVFNDTAHRLKTGDTRNKYGEPTIEAEGSQLRPMESNKYLGIYLDPRLKSRRHIDEVIDKYRCSLPTLISICQNTLGYSWEARRVMVKGAVYSHVLYCLSAFYHRLSLKIHRNQLRELQHQCDRMCVRACCSISADAIAVLNISPPLIHRIQARSLRWLQLKNCPILQLGIFADILADGSAPFRANFQKVIATE